MSRVDTAPDAAGRATTRSPAVARWATYVRRAGALLLVGWAAFMVATDRLADVCRDEVAPDSSVVRVCEPIGPTSLPVLCFLLIVVLLLLPDLSEIELAGVVSLKRAVAEVQDQAATLRGEIADLRVATTAMSNQQQALTVNVVPETLAEGFRQFQRDVSEGETGELADTEELGAYAYLAFTAALDGLVPALFDRFHGVQLVGWILAPDGTFTTGYVVGEVEPTITRAVLDDLDPALRAEGPFATAVPGHLVATAYAVLGRHLSGEASGSGRLVGALTVIAEDRPGEAWAGITASLAAGAEAAAGAYALLLNRLVGEPSTLGPGDSGREARP